MEPWDFSSVSCERMVGIRVWTRLFTSARTSMAPTKTAMECDKNITRKVMAVSRMELEKDFLVPNFLEIRPTRNV